MPAGFLPGREVRRQFAAAQQRRHEMAAVDERDWPRRQLEALREVWADAIDDLPYYSKLVASGQAPRQIGSWEELRNIPVLTRQVIQDRPSDFVRRSAPPDGIAITGGSTGSPVHLGISQAERDLARIVKLAEWQRLGYTSASRLFIVWGHSHLLGTGWRRLAKHATRLLTDAYLGYRRVDAHRLNRAVCEQYAAAIVRYRPAGVIGYAAALDLLARYTPQFRDRFHALGLRFVLLTAESPPRADTVAVIGDLFGCPVVQEYGGADFLQVAFKVGDDPFDVYDDLNYVECETADPASAEARPLLLTSLYRRYVPLVRYRVGDAVCGPVFLPNGHVTRFDSMAGRINDTIQLADGDSIHSVSVIHSIRQEPSVHNIQLALHDDGIEISLVSMSTDRSAMEQRIRGRLAQVHPALSKARFTYVEDLQTSRAGKRRWFVDHRTSPPCAASRES